MKSPIRLITVALIVLLTGLVGYAQTISQSSKVNVHIDSTLTKSLSLSQIDDKLVRDYAISLSNGTGANQANNVWHARRTLTASATEDLDLAGVLTSSNGQTLTFTRVKFILVYAATANTNTVNVSRSASNGVPIFAAAGDLVGVTPGGMFILAAPNATGIPVTASTGDLITVTNSAGSTSVTYDIVVIGTV